MNMKRVVILGRGGAGKSTVAVKLSNISGLPVIELDKHFWQTGLQPLSLEKWREVQSNLASKKTWIMDGDLGKYDALEVRLSAADTVIILDFSVWRCAYRAIRRSRERADFWWWLITWRFISRPKIIASIKEHTPKAEVHILRSPRALEQWLSALRHK